jgi:large subunit ribosomal protein L11
LEPPHGQEDRRLYKATSSRGRGQSVATAQIEKGSPIPVVITAYQDRSFTFEMRQPPVTFWLKKAAGLKIGKKPASGSKTPGRGFVGKVTSQQIREIAEKKIVDLNCDSIDSAVKMIQGSARSMGLEVVG